MFPWLQVRVLTSDVLVCRAHTSAANHAAATTFAFIEARFEAATALDRLTGYTICNICGCLFD